MPGWFAELDGWVVRGAEPMITPDDAESLTFLVANDPVIANHLCYLSRPVILRGRNGGSSSRRPPGFCLLRPEAQRRLGDS